MRRLLLLAVSLMALPSCQNSCQRICSRMAAYARDCGQQVPARQVRACVDAQSGQASRDDRRVCRQSGNAGTLRDEWTCDDLAVYWSRVDSSDTGLYDSGN